MDDGELLSQGEVARLLRVGRTTIWNWIEQGRLASVEVVAAGRRRDGFATVRRVRRAALDAFIAANGLTIGVPARLPALPRPPRPPKPVVPGVWDVFVTSVEVAARLGISQTCAWKWIRAGRIPSEMVLCRKSSRAKSKEVRRVRRAVLEAYIAAEVPRPKMGRPRRPGTATLTPD